MWWQIVTGLQTRGDAAGLITWAVSVDSTTARAHQHALLATAELVRRERARSASHDVSSTRHADNGRPACCGCGESVSVGWERRRLLELLGRSARSVCRHGTSNDSLRDETAAERKSNRSA